MKKYYSLMTTALVLCFLLTLAAKAYFEDYPLTPCPYEDAPHYSPDLAVAVQDKQLRLLDTSSGAIVRVLEDQILDIYPYNLYWGLNCRYFFANDIVQPLDKSYARFTNIYDLTTGAHIFRTRRDPFFVQVWSPSREQFIIKSVTGTYLMSETLSQPIFLFKHNPVGTSMRRYQWDTARNQLLVIFADNAGYLNMYDMNTGIALAAISNPAGCAPPINYVASLNSHYLTLFTAANHAGKPACITVYNRDTGAQQSVNAGELTVTRDTQIALSPDGRYLVIGILALRVWDLANLPANFSERVPTYRHEGPLAAIEKVDFVDSTTVQTLSDEGRQRWNIITGNLLS